VHRRRRTGALELGRGDADRLHRRWIWIDVGLQVALSCRRGGELPAREVLQRNLAQLQRDRVN
jgi:hypothetical protein